MSLRLLWLLILFASLIACQNKTEQTGNAADGKYGIVVFAGEDNDEEYFLQTNSLSAGEVKIPEQATEIHSMLFGNHDGYYYGIDDRVPFFTKYKPGNKGLEVEKTIDFDRKTWMIYDSWYNWVDERTMLVGSSMDGEQFTYKLIDVVDMRTRAQGNINIPKPPKGLKYGGLIGQLRGNRLFLAYTYFNGWQTGVAPSDTTYLAVVDFPSMQTVQVHKDTRSTWPGGIYLHAPYSIEQEGDIYMLAAPGDRTYAHPKAVSGIFKIKKGEETFDKDYFFELTDNKKQECYLLYNLGDGKALVKMVDKDKAKKFTDYMTGFNTRYCVLDLNKKTKKELDIPLSMLAFTESVLVENGKAYLAVTPGKNESFIWEYDIKTGALKKGAKIEGQVLELHRLK